MATKPITRKISGRVLSVDVPIKVDPESGEPVLEPGVLGKADRAIAALLAQEGPVDGESFCFMRRSIGAQAKDLAALLGVSPETVSRWETGARDVDRFAWIVLGDLVLEAAGKSIETRARLERLASGAKPPRERHVEL